MNTDKILSDAAAAYVTSPHVSELRARLQMSPFNRKQERKRIRDDARETLRLSVGFYQVGLIEQLILAWTIAKWVKWIMEQVFNNE